MLLREALSPDAMTASAAVEALARIEGSSATEGLLRETTNQYVRAAFGLSSRMTEYTSLGFDVAVHYQRSAGAAEDTVREIRASGRRSAGFAADLADADVFVTIHAAAERFFRVVQMPNLNSIEPDGRFNITTKLLIFATPKVVSGRKQVRRIETHRQALWLLRHRDDLGQVLGRIVLEAMGDAETVPKRGGQQARAGCDPDELTPFVDVELLEQVLDVLLRRPRGDAQPFGDRAVGQALRQQAQHLVLTRRHRRHAQGDHTDERVDQHVDQVLADDPPPDGDAADAVSELREVIGATDPAEAEEGTVRALYAESKGRNSIHASDAPETAAREIRFFFSEADEIGSR